LLREIDKGLAKSRVGIVLVAPALLRRVEGAGIADKELSALLARDSLFPGCTTRPTKPSALSVDCSAPEGVSTAEDPMADIAAKLAEPVTS
jgi:hypothetical protein